LKQLSPLRFGILLGFDLAVIALAFAALARWPSVPVGAACVFVIGTRQHSLAILGHESTHFLVARRRWLNDLVGNVVGFWPLFVTNEGYRRWHFQHHQTVGTGDDPERAVKRGRLYTLPLKPWQFVLIFVGDLVGLGIPELARLVYTIRPPSWSYYLGPALLWTSFVLGAWWCHALWIPGVWVLATLTAFWSVYRIRSWAEHTGIGDQTYRFRAGPLLEFLFFPNKSSHHFEHHRWPSIPCYNLEKTRPLEDKVPVMSVREMFRFFAGEPAVRTMVPAATAPEPAA
jgi:fatty acid desaturase